MDVNGPACATCLAVVCPLLRTITPPCSSITTVIVEPPRAGLEAAFLDNRDKLLRFLRARGAGDSAEDLVQEVWLKIAAGPPGPVAAPLSYLFRTADLLMIDRFRSSRQSGVRDRDWGELNAGDPPGVANEPSAERSIAAAQEAASVLAMLERLGPRVAAIFRRHRIEGEAQKVVAEKLGISVSTVEADLRTAYRALAEWKDKSG
ncbi:RNA polymerase sigma-70 factor (ECF subfamily) [Novosphingobium chloroacetimidivorans]|uniref:RNA polymerase sigma-70 factor (ECF subfamily) n=1 Tax=Novosphingobium chloroacetimidivorans TaxID=1428314 RepID=A0A7W7K9P7_9SPHN|nr:RNA polymerase sigma factor [Novosphingobium chloroacetimidivorans]MBB4858812.1 RNA polymerase sigma-70 factor (ECF subfamily) [Novosphingobium chloroacetimidivorans]